MGFFSDDSCVVGLFFTSLVGLGGVLLGFCVCVCLWQDCLFFCGGAVSLLHWINKTIFKLLKQEKLT